MLYHFKDKPWTVVIIIYSQYLLLVETLERPRPKAYLTIEISNGATTYETFQSRCHALPNIQHTNLSDQMTEKMRQSGLPSLWLPIKRIPLGGWYWLNGQFFGMHLSKPTTFIPGLDCAVLRPRDSWIDDVHCATIYPFYLCSTEERLPAVNDSGQVIELSGSKYVLKHQNVTWYEAKQSCHMEGYELASIPNLQLENTTRKLKAVLGNNNCWIGLRRRDYFFQQNGSKADVVIQRWNLKSLCVCPEKDCAVLKMGYWEPENCSATHNYACLVPIESIGAENSRKMIIGMSVGGTIGVMLVVIIAVFCWLRPWKKKNARSNRPISTEGHDDEPDASRLPLTDASESKNERLVMKNILMMPGFAVTLEYIKKKLKLEEAAVSEYLQKLEKEGFGKVCKSNAITVFFKLPPKKKVLERKLKTIGIESALYDSLFKQKLPWKSIDPRRLWKISPYRAEERN